MEEQGYSAVIAAPFGRLGLRCSAQALQGIEFLPSAHPLRAPGSALAQQAAAQLAAYLDDPAQVFTLPLAPGGTVFQQRVWDALRQIPLGRTRSYGELARSLGSAARAIGAACRSNPVPLVVPCHRVLAQEGLGGFAGARAGELLEIKQWLLRHERALPPAYGSSRQHVMEFGWQ